MEQPLGPSDLPAVYALLEAASAQGPAGGGAVEAALESYATRVGFCSCLLEIISMPELRQKSEPRWLAAVYFKNSINRYWRGRRESLGISDAEKPLLRAKLLELIPEPDPKVALQLALLTSKIARIDFPREWPGLIPGLKERLQSPDLLVSQRAALFLHHTLKELSTKRLGADQRNFAQLTSELFDILWAAWLADTRVLVQGFGSLFPPLPPGAGATASPVSLGEAELAVMGLTCQRWILSLKCLRRMLIFGHQSDFKSVQEVPAVKQVSGPFLEACKTFLEILGNAVSCGAIQALSTAGSTAEAFLRKALLKLMKTCTGVLEAHPYSFAAAGTLVPLLAFTFSNVTGHSVDPTEQTALASSPAVPGQAGMPASTAEGRGGTGCPLPAPVSAALDSFPQLRIQSMLFLQEALKSVAYKQSKAGRVVDDVLPSMEQTRGSMAELGRMQLNGFLTAARGTFLADILIRRYMVLGAEDLQLWEQDPVGFVHEQDAIQWKDKLRPCAEALYLLLFENFKELLVPVALGALREAMGLCPPPPTSDSIVALSPQLLFKEASYDAVGAASYDLHDHMDLESWYTGTLSLELGNKSPNGRILRRKVAWLLGQWVSKIKDSFRRRVYQALVSLLADADLVVRLASCSALRVLVDDVSFYEEEFLEFVEPSLSLLFSLLHEVQEFESQVMVVSLVSLIIERVGDKVVPHAQKILSQLPEVWEKSEGESMLRIQVMLALQRLVVALGPHSPSSYHILFPILRYSTDISQPDELNMLEDGLHLWSTSIRHAPAMEPAFMDFFQNLVPITDRSLEHVQVIVKIMEGYVLLGGVEFLQRYIGELVHMLSLLLGNVKEKMMLPVLGLVDLLVQCFPADAPQALQVVMQRILLLQVGPTEYSNLVRGMAATVLARVVFLNSTFFSSFITSSAVQQQLQEQSQQKGMQPPFVLFLDSWLDLIDSVPVAAKKKLSALALCQLLPLQQPYILDRLELIISVCTSVLNEGGPAPEQTSIGHDFLGTSATDEFLGSSVECEYSRRLQVASGDLVNQVDVVAFVKDKLQSCQQVHGKDALQTALSKVHVSMLSMLQLAS